MVEGMYDARRPPLSVAAQVLSLATRVLVCTITGRAPSRPIASTLCQHAVSISPPNPLAHCILQARAASAPTPYPLHTSALAPPPPHHPHRQLAGVATFDASGPPHRLGAPSLVIHGTEDVVVPVECGHRLAAGLADR